MGRKVLFTSPEGLGHIHPMVPLARAIDARGHDVLWAVPADGVGHVERAGIRAVAAGPAGPTNLPEVLGRHPELKALSQRERPDVMFGKVFGEAVASAMFPDVLRVAIEWRPDLVVADAAEFAGHIAAAELGVPSVTKGFGPLLPERRVATIDEEVAPLWRARGLQPRQYGGATSTSISTSIRPRSSRRRRRTSRAVSCCAPSRTTGPTSRLRSPCPPPRRTRRWRTSRWARCSTTRRRSSPWSRR